MTLLALVLFALRLCFCTVWFWEHHSLRCFSSRDFVFSHYSTLAYFPQVFNYVQREHCIAKDSTSILLFISLSLVLFSVFVYGPRLF